MNNLTKGGQVFFQNIRMFLDVFWKLVIVFLIGFSVIFSSLIYYETTPYERYEAEVLVENAPFSLLFKAISEKLDQMGLVSESQDQSFKIDFKNPDGEVVKLSQNQVISEISNSSFFEKISWILKLSLIQALLGSLVLTVISAKFLMSYGQRLSEKKILRGTQVVEAKILSNLLKRKFKKEALKFSINGIPLPPHSETQHIWINGTTGSGKTVAMSELMAQVREGSHRAIVYDIMGTFVGRFYRPGKDIILNPFDERSMSWNVWAECQRGVDFDLLAASQIPISGAGHQDPFWLKSARSLYAATARQLQKTGEMSNSKLLKTLLMADLDELRELLKNTEVESLLSKDLDKTALSVKAVLADYIKGLRFLKDEGPVFSIKDWVKKEDDSWLFISSRPDTHETLMPLISTWYDLAIATALSLPNSKDRRIFNFLDELPTLQSLPSLQKGLAQGRQKGLCFVLGTQDLSQLRVSYGVDQAKSIIGNANTKLILRTTDDAENIAAMFNQSEVQEYQENLSYGVNENRDGVSINKHRNLQHLILPSELQMLDDLEGYLRIPGKYPIAKVKLDYVNYPELNERFIPREQEVDLLSEIENQAHPENTEVQLKKSKRIPLEFGKFSGV